MDQESKKNTLRDAIHKAMFEKRIIGFDKSAVATVFTEEVINFAEASRFGTSSALTRTGTLLRVAAEKMFRSDKESDPDWVPLDLEDAIAKSFEEASIKPESSRQYLEDFPLAAITQQMRSLAGELTETIDEVRASQALPSHTVEEKKAIDRIVVDRTGRALNSVSVTLHLQEQSAYADSPTAKLLEDGLTSHGYALGESGADRWPQNAWEGVHEPHMTYADRIIRTVASAADGSEFGSSQALKRLALILKAGSNKMEQDKTISVEGALMDSFAKAANQSPLQGNIAVSFAKQVAAMQEHDVPYSGARYQPASLMMDLGQVFHDAGNGLRSKQHTGSR